jgi:inorganic pyrophosphatase
LVALSLYGGFLHNSGLTDNKVTLTEPLVFSGLLIGAMLPYAFSAFTMKSVGKAALGMVEEVRRQIRENPGILQGTVEPDYKSCIKISTRASLIEMIAPGCLVIFTPMLIGIAFGPKAIAGFLPGAIVSGVQMAISAANTGGAWDNAKKYIEAGNMVDDEGNVFINIGNVVRKGSDLHKAAVVGDTVGDPLKDTSGPALNILIKLMAILSLVFADLFLRIHPN